MALPLPVLGPAAANVLLGLAASLAWGCGDFAGGLASRRSSVFAVVLIVQATGVAMAVILVAVRGEPIPAPPTVLLAVGAGMAGTVGILGLYQGLAVGRMGVVAPVTAVIGAALPVVAGFLLEGLPGPLVLGGIALGLLSVVLVSRVPEGSGGRSGIELAIVAGLAIAVFSVLVSRFPTGQVFGPTAIMRAVTTLLVVSVIALGRLPARLPGRLALAAVGVGVLDLTGNVCYILATQAGRLDVAVLLASLYPVVTVILAVSFLHERVSRTHALGIALAAAAVGCIAVG